MAKAVILPKQGQSVESCIITQWYKKVGDRVEKGDMLFAYETDKSSFEEEAREEGILLAVHFDEGDEVPVLSEVALIGAEGENIQEGKPEKEDTAEPSGRKKSGGESENAAKSGGEEKAPSTVAAMSTTAANPVMKSNGRIRISPRAKKIAEMKGISFDQIRGSGPNGRIIVRDIDAAESGTAAMETASELPAETAAHLPSEEKTRGITVPSGTVAPSGTSVAAPPRPAPVLSGEFEDRPLSNLRKLVAKAMHASLQNSAQLTHHLSADARSILGLRKKVKKSMESGGDNITLNDMVCYAVVRALKKHPGANVHFLGESVRHFRNIHLGIAVDTERGLMVPVVRNADELSLPGLSNRIAQLAAACRSGSIDPDLLQPDAATFTVSNLGNYGVEMFTPVINLPQAGILGVNTIIERPARMEDGTFGFVPFIGLSLTYDHRVLDGGPATLFLAEIKKEIEKFNHELINI